MTNSPRARLLLPVLCVALWATGCRQALWPFFDHNRPIATPETPLATMEVRPGRLPYTWETQGLLLVRPDVKGASGPLFFEARLGQDLLLSQQAVKPGKICSFPLDLARLSEGSNEIQCRLLRKDQELANQSVQVIKVPAKPFEVKVDFETLGLWVDGLPYLPMGFYCRNPMNDLPEVEVGQGFNNLIPFDYAVPIRKVDLRGHTPEQLAELKRIMDRCASLGMKVHCDIKVIAQEPSSDQKWDLLRKEIEAFKDHPALLAWYICDEPSGWGMPPEPLEETYRFVKAIDPYHPVTMVFCDPKTASLYANAADILVADPYPIPTLPVSTVAEWTDRILTDVKGLKPVWIVPQAFGGGEWWAREPSAREERVMTYLALIHGATGIQYFVRVPPNGHPKSPRLWSECRNLASETGELTPALLSSEPKPKVSCSPKTIHASAWLDRGSIVILAANLKNAPVPAHFFIHEDYSGPATVLFENRDVRVTWGAIDEVIEAFGTRAYRIPIQPGPVDDLLIDPKNLTVNPSFEAFANVGTPDGCYYTPGKDRGATGIVDPQRARHGQHSLRLTTPAEGQGILVRPYRVSLAKDQTYTMSVWAKAKSHGLIFEMTLAGMDPSTQQFTLSEEWQEFRLTGKAPEKKKSNLSMKLISPGTAWFDVLQVIPTP